MQFLYGPINISHLLVLVVMFLMKLVIISFMLSALLSCPNCISVYYGCKNKGLSFEALGKQEGKT